MSNYLFTYRASADYIPGGDIVDAWDAYFEGMGANLVDRGNPVFERTTIGDCGTDINPLGGYSIVAADDLGSAVAMARCSPILDGGGGVEVGVIATLNPARTQSIQS